MLLEIALGTLALTLVVYWHVTRNFGYWKRLGVPHDTALPFFGSRKDVLLMRSNEGVDTDRIYRKFPDERYVGFFEGDQPVLLVRDPELVRRFFAKESEMPLSRRLLTDESSPFSDSLLFAHGVRWKRSRVLMSPFFTTARVKRGLATFLGNVDEIKRSLMGGDGGAVLEVGDVFARYSMDNMAALIFGLDVSTLRDPDHKFRRLFVSVLGSGVANQLRRLLGWFFRSLLPVKYNFPGIEVSRYMDKTVDRLAATTGDDLIHTLLKFGGREIVSGDDGERTKPLVMTKELVAANAFMVFIAGTDTSASAIAFSLLELALNHEMQRKLYEEIQEKTQQRGEQEEHQQQDDNDDDAGGLTYETLKEMKYLGMIVSETLRKWAPAVAIGRVTTAKTVFPGTNLTLESGTGILIPIWSLQNDPKYFPDPERFDPERFSEEGKAQIVPGSYLPFADGGHICIGMHIGLLQVKAAVASIVKDYRVDTCEKTHIPVKQDPTAFITSQLGGTWLKFTRRSTQ